VTIEKLFEVSTMTVAALILLPRRLIFTACKKTEKLYKFKELIFLYAISWLRILEIVLIFIFL
jgi:hypothetical protein